MQNILENIIVESGLGRPTDADIERARIEMPNHPVAGKHISKNPMIYKLQLKTFAMTYVVRRQNEGVKEPESLSDRFFETKLENQRKASTALMSGTIYAGIALHDPSNKETAMLKGLRDRFDPISRAHALLLGGPGVGKTFASAAWASSQMTTTQTSKGLEWTGAAFVTSRNLSRLLGNDSSNLQWMKFYEQVKVLVIDDLKIDKEGTLSEALKAQVQDLFAEREARRKTTIMTSNATRAQFESTYGPRMISRLEGDGMVIESGGQDLRRIAA